MLIITNGQNQLFGFCPYLPSDAVSLFCRGFALLCKLRQELFHQQIYGIADECAQDIADNVVRDSLTSDECL